MASPQHVSCYSPGPAHLQSRCQLARGKQRSQEACCLLGAEKYCSSGPWRRAPAGGQGHVALTGIVSLLREPPIPGLSLCVHGRTRNKARGRDGGGKTLRMSLSEAPRKEAPSGGAWAWEQMCLRARRPGPEPLAAAPSGNCERWTLHTEAPGLSVTGWRQPWPQPSGMGT